MKEQIFIRIQGPGMDTTLLIDDENAIEILAAIVKSIKKKLNHHKTIEWLLKPFPCQTQSQTPPVPNVLSTPVQPNRSLTRYSPLEYNHDRLNKDGTPRKRRKLKQPIDLAKYSPLEYHLDRLNKDGTPRKRNKLRI